MTGSAGTTDSGIAIITGATGGMGRSCASLLGHRFPLMLTDIDAARLDDFARALRSAGHVVTGCLAGDLADPRLAERLVRTARGQSRIAAMVHTAGLSPALAGWREIVRTNIVATELLLRALEQDLEPGIATVLIASMAGHLAPACPEIDALLTDIELETLADRLRGPIEARASPKDERGYARAAYSQSKRAVIRMCERRAAAWGAKGARILSISPGLIETPMGRAEAKGNANAAKTLEMTPMGRWGSPLDIACAVDFLVSDQASFITGCDLRIDGGVTPVLRDGPARPGWTPYGGT